MGELDNTLIILHNKLKRRVNVVREYADDLPLIEAIGRMRDAVTHMAEVVDDGDRSLGIVTLEDALERLIGEVRDPAHRGSGRRPVQLHGHHGRY